MTENYFIKRYSYSRSNASRALSICNSLITGCHRIYDANRICYALCRISSTEECQEYVRMRTEYFLHRSGVKHISHFFNEVC